MSVSQESRRKTHKLAGKSRLVPGFGTREIHTVVSDYTGTLSCGGRLTQGVREKLVTLLDLGDIRIVSSDSFGTATEELRGVLKPDNLSTEKHDLEKQECVKHYDPRHVVAFGKTATTTD